MAIFEYGLAETEYLSQRDRLLGLAIARVGPIEREVNPDLFAVLIRNIVAQQVAKKAAATVWDRLCDSLGEITPARVAGVDGVDIQRCGLSMRKVGYIKSAADAFVAGQVDVRGFPRMSDQAIIGALTTLPGVGVWTAEMLLIFSLARPDVLSWRDLAVRRGMKNLYGLTDLSKEHFEECRRRYSPYGTVASLYLWELARQPAP